MPPKTKSLAQKMNFNDKRGTMILLQGSAEASSSKEDKVTRRSITSILSQGHVGTDSESEELTAHKEELTVKKESPKK